MNIKRRKEVLIELTKLKMRYRRRVQETILKEGESVRGIMQEMKELTIEFLIVSRLIESLQRNDAKNDRNNEVGNKLRIVQSKQYRSRVSKSQ